MSDLPVGYHALHRDANFNFQLNRLVADGSAEMLAEVRDVASRLRTFDHWTREMSALSARSEAAGRLGDACRYARAAEFFVDPRAPDKRGAYERFVSLFERAHDGYERHAVPSPDGPLNVLRVAGARAPRGTLLVHGGFDSFIEEFFSLLVVAGDAGFEVIAFDGPGQGASLVRGGVPMTPAWQRPVSAILDHFDRRDVTLVGISLGGCLALRAAAEEPRVARVVAWDVLYDFYDCVASRRGALAKGALDALLARGADTAVDVLFRAAARMDELVGWGIAQGMYVVGASRPSAFLRAARAYTTRDVAAKVRQDVLLLAGQDDHFVPVAQLTQQERALVNARSVTTRLFTRDEQAAAHCQFGNLGLAMATVLSWIGSRIGGTA